MRSVSAVEIVGSQQSSSSNFQQAVFASDLFSLCCYRSAMPKAPQKTAHGRASRGGARPFAARPPHGGGGDDFGGGTPPPATAWLARLRCLTCRSTSCSRR